jgi:hypothetical protein
MEGSIGTVGSDGHGGVVVAQEAVEEGGTLRAPFLNPASHAVAATPKPEFDPRLWPFE